MWKLRPWAKPADAWSAAIGSLLLTGLAVARLTLAMNPHLAEDVSDKLLLHFWLLLGYGSVGVLLGGLGAGAMALSDRLFGKSVFSWCLATGAVTTLALAPLRYLVMLPDMHGDSAPLTRFLASDRAAQVSQLAVTLSALAILGCLTAPVLGAIARRLKTSLHTLWAMAWVLAALALVVLIGPDAGAPPRAGAETSAETSGELPPAPEQAPPRVVLLCIDGADLDDMVLPMVGRGELPSFARLMREGTWGSLETLEPTLSAVIWTTLITGKTPAEHGIRHFLHFRLPGMRQAIYQFPLHTGFNFHLFPALEKIPGIPVMRAPYTSNMRHVEALWNIVGRRYPVGAYRWLVSWPAEEVNGFSLAGGLGWVQFSPEARHEVAGKLSGQAARPAALGRLLERSSSEVPDAALVPYVGEGFEIDRRDPRMRAILGSLSNAASRDLPVLAEQFNVRFLAANFYSVDPYSHLFNAYRDRGGIFSNAIAQSYRFTDERLGEVLDAFGDETQVIVVSDHGFDFENNHHTYAPKGIFFARGPAFDRGRKVEGLSVYDVAPLVLHLLDMPLPDDMPGARTLAYRSALSDEFLAGHPAGRIATYETLKKASHESIASPKDEELREILKSLGYIE